MHTQDTVVHDLNKCRSCALRRSCLPGGLQEADLPGLESIIRHNRRLPRQEHLYHYGDPMHQVYAVRTGAFKTYTFGADGSERITGFAMPGQLLGLDALADRSFPSHAMALEASVVCIIPLAKLEQLAATDAHLRSTLLRALSRELKGEKEHLGNNREPAGPRLVAFLLDMAARQGRRGLSAAYLNLPMTRAEIGNYLGLTTETISRLFTRYRQLGLLECTGREVHLLDPPALHGLLQCRSLEDPCDSASVACC
ncbi:helix-turn-helix domain-containing protein [Pseudomonas oligotrophica]|uniref:helix-turn-helix domain-containing protein n=1 Tax=Pseudomonas oligotrophica TaxID=2912055 RepID=UPI001F025CAA|nr:helix-turn-helix domain-containing protein [Pseudomonas oligotrophica]MCF7202530.1 helix-turn-helix domain-containing protein [Pseudomonas oligotrophica]